MDVFPNLCLPRLTAPRCPSPRLGAWRMLFVFFLSLFAPNAFAFGLAVGLAGVEEGNDKVRPAIGLRLSWSEAWVTDGLYYGRDFGPVHETAYLLGLARHLPIAKSKFLYATFGLCLLSERTVIDGGGAADAEGRRGDLSESSWAPGVTVGVGSKLWSVGPFRSELIWTTHIFPAGMAGALLLTHGRKQEFFYASGVDL